MIEKRAFISFDEPCEFQCKHCYSYGIERDTIRTQKEIINSLSNQEFDVIYVSQKNDNFSNPISGIQLCRNVFRRYHSHVFIITRNVFNNDDLLQLIDLKNEIDSERKHLFIAISLNSLQSYAISENPTRVPSPYARIEFVQRLSEHGFHPILMLRPILPNAIIPIKECINVIDHVKNSISCVVSSELGVNARILEQLGLTESVFHYSDDQEYLQGAIECKLRFINVENELKQIKEKCESMHIPFYSHSMPAINHIDQQYRLSPI